MAQKVQPIVLVHHRGIDDPADFVRNVCSFTKDGWQSGSPIETSSEKEGSTGTLRITLHPDPAAFETTSERH